MANLDTLPLELVLKIISAFDKADSSTLYALCLTSKLLRSLCQPLLFHTFRASDSLSALVPFAHSLALNPHLAAHVQDITLCLSRDVSRLPAPKQPISVLLPAFRRAVAKVNPPDELQTQWLDKVQELHVSAFIALVLIQTPNLRRLDFTTSDLDMYDVDIWRDVGRLQLERGTTYLSGKLKELKLEYTLDWCYPTFEDVEELYLPFLKDVDVLHLGPLTFMDAPPIEPGSLNISDLKLQVSQPSEVTVDFIRGCKTLKRFEYQVVEDDGGYFLAGHLQRGLAPHARCLEELTASIRLSYGSDSEAEGEAELEDGDEDEDERFSSFADFVSLKRLDVEGSVMKRLRRADFPPQLEVYTVRTSGYYLRCVSALLDSSKDAAWPPLRMNVVAEVKRDSRTFKRWKTNPDRECAVLVEKLHGTRISVMLVLIPEGSYPAPSGHVVWADADGYRREDSVNERNLKGIL